MDGNEKTQRSKRKKKKERYSIITESNNRGHGERKKECMMNWW